MSPAFSALFYLSFDLFAASMPLMKGILACVLAFLLVISVRFGVLICGFGMHQSFNV